MMKQKGCLTIGNDSSIHKGVKWSRFINSLMQATIIDHIMRVMKNAEDIARTDA